MATGIRKRQGGCLDRGAYFWEPCDFIYSKLEQYVSSYHHKLCTIKRIQCQPTTGHVKPAETVTKCKSLLLLPYNII